MLTLALAQPLLYRCCFDVLLTAPKAQTGCVWCWRVLLVTRHSRIATMVIVTAKFRAKATRSVYF
jgi:hypothetical protein